jgi:hypothetical protein
VRSFATTATTTRYGIATLDIVIKTYPRAPTIATHSLHDLV